MRYSGYQIAFIIYGEYVVLFFGMSLNKSNWNALIFFAFVFNKLISMLRSNLHMIITRKTVPGVQ
jgi:hypothetical protein